MARSKSLGNFTYQDLEVQELNGYLAGFASTVSTRRYIDAVLEDVTSDLGEMFNRAVDVRALNDQVQFQHIYESGDIYPTAQSHSDTIGNPANRLWQLTYTGTGGRRQIGFVFLPSQQPVPIHPLLLKPGGKSRRTVLPDVHIFTWKAPIMEYGLSVSITPRLSPKQFLAFVDDREGKIMFTQKTINAVPGELQGGKGTTVGQFTRFFQTWWNQVAPARFDAMANRLERETFSDKDIARGKSHRGYGRSKKVIVQTDRDMAYRAAEARAKREWEGRMHTYLARAAQRRIERYGY